MSTNSHQDGAGQQQNRIWRWTKLILLVALALLVVIGLQPAIVGAAAVTIVVDRIDDAPAAQACTAAANDLSLIHI